MRLEARPSLSRTALVVAPFAAIAFTLGVTMLLVAWAGAPIEYLLRWRMALAQDALSRGGKPLSIFDFDFDAALSRRIVFGEHCLGCTAGAGSSCGGATA